MWCRSGNGFWKRVEVERVERVEKVEKVERVERVEKVFVVCRIGCRLSAVGCRGGRVEGERWREGLRLEMGAGWGNI